MWHIRWIPQLWSASPSNHSGRHFHWWRSRLCQCHVKLYGLFLLPFTLFFLSHHLFSSGFSLIHSIFFFQGYLVWDEWLLQLQESTTVTIGDSKRLLPVSLAIGNHEGGGFVVSREEVPFYYHYFLQQLDGITDYADPSQRTSYHYHKVSPQVIVFILDSYIVESITGPQLDWLMALLQRDEFGQVPHKYAVYHAPLFPSSRTFTAWLPELERQSWGPIFETYGFRVNFEHHDHTLKQTWPLVGFSRNDTHGVTYLGDGSYGVDPRTPNTENSELFIMRQQVQHIWQVIVSPIQVTYRAVSSDGTLLLNFTSPSSP